MPEDKTEELYQQLHECMHYDAASLRALALLLNANKKNREFMRFASAELGRNARNMARAVDYFALYFIGQNAEKHTADDFLRLFAYAQLKHEAAMELFAKNKFDYPLYVIRERVAAAKPQRERKPTLAERCAGIVRNWHNIALMDKTIEKTRLNCANELAALPEVAKALEANP